MPVHLARVKQHLVLGQSGECGLRFGDEHGIHLVVEHHLQAHVHVIYLHLEHPLALELGTIHDMVGKHIGD